MESQQVKLKEIFLFYSQILHTKIYNNAEVSICITDVKVYQIKADFT